MKYKMDHIWGNSKSNTTDITTLETKVNNLSQIAAKTNIANTFTANQTVNGVVIVNGEPTEDNQLANKGYVDKKNNFTRIVNHTTALSANQNLQWTIPNNTLVAGKVTEFVVVVPINNVDYEFSVNMLIGSLTYNNVAPILEFSTNDDLTQTDKCKFWVHDNKIKFRTTRATNGLRVYYRISNAVN